MMQPQHKHIFRRTPPGANLVLQTIAPPCVIFITLVAVVIEDELKKKEMKNYDENADADPEQHGKTPVMVTMTMKSH